MPRVHESRSVPRPAHAASAALESLEFKDWESMPRAFGAPLEESQSVRVHNPDEKEHLWDNQVHSGKHGGPAAWLIMHS